MLRKYSNSRSLNDNIKLGVLTSFIAGMVNVSSLVLFFSFTSNITGHFAILADEIANGKWFQVVVVFLWVFLFFSGSFLSNFIILKGKNWNNYISHSIPLGLEILCFLFVGFYGTYFYSETLMETEVLVAVLLFAMGLQNGLTASISNFTVKTTHLTGLTTDLAIHLSMLTQKQYKNNEVVNDKLKLLLSILGSYVIGGIVAGNIILYFQFKVFFFVAIAMFFVIIYDFSKMFLQLSLLKRKRDRLELIRKAKNKKSDVSWVD